MTVKEMIEKLNQYDAESEVVVEDQFVDIYNTNFGMYLDKKGRVRIDIGSEDKIEEE